VEAVPGAAAIVGTKVPLPVDIGVPGSYENIDAGIAGPVGGVNGLIRTCDVQPAAVPRESVTMTSLVKGIANVAGKLTSLPRLRLDGADIERPGVGAILDVTVMVKVVVADP